MAAYVKYEDGGWLESCGDGRLGRPSQREARRSSEQMQDVRIPAGFSGMIQPVIVHAILDQKGKVNDAEVVQSSDSALATAALDVVWRSSYLPAQRRDRPLQREAFINVKFTPASTVHTSPRACSTRSGRKTATKNWCGVRPSAIWIFARCAAT